MEAGRIKRVREMLGLGQRLDYARYMRPGLLHTHTGINVATSL